MHSVVFHLASTMNVSDVPRMHFAQRLAFSLGFDLQSSLAAAGLPCDTALQSLTAVSGETLKDQVPAHASGAPAVFFYLSRGLQLTACRGV